MNVLLRRAMDQLRQRVLRLGVLVYDQVDQATEAVLLRDPALASRVPDLEARIDVIGQETEEECLHVLALHQPVAFDLRMLVAILKMNAQLERVANLGFNMIEQAALLVDHPLPAKLPFDLARMRGITLDMLSLSLESMAMMDEPLARRVREMDDEVDEIHRAMYAASIRAIRVRPEYGPGLIMMMSVSRQLERVADYACGIAKDVLYLTGGEIVRHDKPPGAESVEPSRRHESHDPAASPEARAEPVVLSAGLRPVAARPTA